MEFVQLAQVTSGLRRISARTRFRLPTPRQIRDNWNAVHDDHPPLRHRRRSFLLALVPWLIAVLCLLGYGTATAAGFRHFDVLTPSMGEAAPVGTLVITQRVSLADVKVGDLVTFTRGSPKTYTHRVVDVTPAGLVTRGDINGANDPSTVNASNLVGKVVLRLWGVGWLLRGLPWLIVGWLMVAIFTRALFSLHRRSGARILGAALVFTCVTLWLQPWVRALILSQAARAPGLEAVIVSTGALPVTVEATNGHDTVNLRPGQLDTIYSAGPHPDGRYHFVPTLHLFGWWQVGVGLFIVSPVLYTLLSGWWVFYHPRALWLPERTDGAWSPSNIPSVPFSMPATPSRVAARQGPRVVPPSLAFRSVRNVEERHGVSA